VDELTIISQNDLWLEAATMHFSAMTTFVAIYIAALYVFLRSAPFAVKLIAYTFFVGSFIVFIRMGIQFLDNVYTSIAIQQELMNAHTVTEAFGAWRQPHWYDAVPVGFLWYLLVGMTIVALGWLTFFFHWKQEGEE